MIYLIVFGKERHVTQYLPIYVASDTYTATRMCAHRTAYAHTRLNETGPHKKRL